MAESLAKMAETPALVVGIDLGTTNSCAAVWEKGKKVRVITSSTGSTTIPSVVCFLDDVSSPYVGNPSEIKTSFTCKSENVVKNIKRIMGKDYDSRDQAVVYQKMVTVNEVIDVNNKPKIRITRNEETQDFTAEEISTMILSRIKQLVEKDVQKPVKFAIITVPANFTNQQRICTKNAAEMAGFHILRVINEPTAAAVAYGLEKKFVNDNFEGKNVLVFDLGGGTFDISILSVDIYDQAEVDIAETEFVVIATGGDMRLGGADFDTKLTDHVCNYLKDKHGITISEDHDGIPRLLSICEDAKIRLSTFEQVIIDLASFAKEGQNNDANLNYVISRLELEELCSPWFKKMVDAMDGVIHSDGKNLEIQEVIFVGGATRMPKVQGVVREYFEKQKFSCGTVFNNYINPDETVAIGAAGAAVDLLDPAVKKGQLKEMRITDVIPNSIGIEVEGGGMSKIVPRFTQIPNDNKHVFIYTTARDYQTSETKTPKIGRGNWSRSLMRAKDETHVTIVINVNTTGSMVRILLHYKVSCKPRLIHIFSDVSFHPVPDL